MNEYEAVYEKLFVKNLKRYASLKKQIRRCIDRVLNDPYYSTEQLVDSAGKLNLAGCRSSRVNRNFRVIFVICEECRLIPDCEYCFCEGLTDRTVVFLTVCPHDKAYEMK